MNERFKKIIVVIGFILSIFAIGYALYYTFFKPAAPSPTVEPTPEELGGLPTAGEAGERPVTTPTTGGALPPAAEVAGGGRTVTTALTQTAISSTTASTDGAGVNFYNPEDGKFYTIDENGNLVALSDTKFPEVENVSWNKDGEKAVLEFPDGTNIVYDFNDERQVTLPKHWEDFEFSPKSDEILAKSIGIDPSNRWLVTTNDDGSNAKAFQALGENADKVTVSWSPNDQVVAFSDTAESIGLDRKFILPIGKNSENYKGLTVEGLFFLPLWSPDGKTLLYSAAGDYSDNKPLLWLVDATPATMGEDRHSLGLNTWVDKCTFTDSKIVYCAVPRNLPSNAGLGRVLYLDYPDTLYKIDLSNSKVTLVAIPEEDIPMENLSVSDDGSILYFTSGLDGTLQMMRLR